MRKTCLNVVVIAGFLLITTAALPQHRRHSRQSSTQSTKQDRSKVRTVRAQKGDTLRSIAERFSANIQEVERLNRLTYSAALKKGQTVTLPADTSEEESGDQKDVKGFRLRFADGSSMDVDQAWRQGSTVWYRKGNIGQSVDREVRAIEPIRASDEKTVRQVPNSPAADKKLPGSPVTWIYLVGGARFKVEDVRQVSDGAWYSRGNLSVFLASDRIARIERIEPALGNRGGQDIEWTSGNSRIDQLIRTNGSRFGIDPYLIFCVIEHESHFHTRALSPKGAQGLMQLMPGTARRFDVRRPYDIAENIRGGTQYLKELMTMFSGQVNLVLASYNAGEGAVLKYGRTVPPYKETRDYVKRIGKRYGLNGREANPDNEITPPR